MKNYFVIAALGILLTGCNQNDGDTDSPNQTAHSMQIYEITDGQSFQAKVLPNNSPQLNWQSLKSLPKQMLCDIQYDENKVTTLNCQKPALNIDKLTSQGVSFIGKEWLCEGLDGFGGRFQQDNESKVSKLVFNEDGSYSITHTAKESDYIWHIVPTTVSGLWVKLNQSTQIKIKPNKVTNSIVEKLSQLTFEDASEHLRLTEILTIKILSNNELSGSTEVHRENQKTSYNFNCLAK